MEGAIHVYYFQANVTTFDPLELVFTYIWIYYCQSESNNFVGKKCQSKQKGALSCLDLLSAQWSTSTPLNQTYLKCPYLMLQQENHHVCQTSRSCESYIVMHNRIHFYEAYRITLISNSIV